MFLHMYICTYAYICIPINETMMADCTSNDNKTLKTGRVTPSCSLYLYFVL